MCVYKKFDVKFNRKIMNQNKMTYKMRPNQIVNMQLKNMLQSKKKLCKYYWKKQKSNRFF